MTHRAVAVGNADHMVQVANYLECVDSAEYGLEVLPLAADGSVRVAVVHEGSGDRMTVFAGADALQQATSEMIKLNGRA